MWVPVQRSTPVVLSGENKHGLAAQPCSQLFTQHAGTLLRGEGTFTVQDVTPTSREHTAAEATVALLGSGFLRGSQSLFFLCSSSSHWSIK